MKKYCVIIGEKSFEIEALNLKSAKHVAQFNKRMQKLKGKTEVKIIN